MRTLLIIDVILIRLQSQSWGDGLYPLPMMFTVNGAYRSDNNLIRVRSAELAQDYLVEFIEMFADRQFGANSPANTPLPAFLNEGTRVEVYFSPDDGAIELLTGLIEDAQGWTTVFLPD